MLRQAGDLLLFGSRDRRIHAVKAADGEEVWVSDEGDDRPAPPVVAGAIGFAGGRNGGLAALDLADGRTLWSWQPAAPVAVGLLSGIMWPPVVAGDVLLASSMDGKLYAFRGGTDRAAWERWRRDNPPPPRVEE